MGGSIDPHPMSLLTLREREVGKCVADGMAGVEVGEKLRVSPRTVKSAFRRFTRSSISRAAAS
jgi:DNA-binding CsgD family transcriptional regulator